MRFKNSQAFSLRIFTLVVLLIVPCAAVADADPRLDIARALFQQYVAMENGFDPAIADLYRDDTRIIVHRNYPNGLERHFRISGDQWKTMIRTLMPMARAANDRNEYSNVTYAIEGPGVRINAMRHVVRKGYTAPYSMLVAPDDAGKWRIVEEVAWTRP